MILALSPPLLLFLLSQRMVTAVLNGSTRGDWGVKETQAIVGLIGLLANELDADSPEVRGTCTREATNLKDIPYNV